MIEQGNRTQVGATYEESNVNTEFMLLAIYNKPRLNIEEVCSALGIATATGYTHRSLGKFPVPMSGSPLMADIRDVATELDRLRDEAHKQALPRQP